MKINLKNRFRIDTKYRISNKVTISARSQSENTTDDVGFLQKKMAIFIWHQRC